MLKLLLLSGWYRVQPFSKYIVLALLLAPLMAASGHSTEANLSEKIAQNSSVAEITDSVATEPEEYGPAANFDNLQVASLGVADDSILGEPDSAPNKIAVITQPERLEVYKIDSLAEADGSSPTQVAGSDSLAAVELAPVPNDANDANSVSKSLPSGLSASQRNLVERLKAARIQPVLRSDGTVAMALPDTKSLKAAKLNPSLRPSQPLENPVEAPKQGQDQEDPLGSPHRIPWKWITATQETVAARGGSGTRYYRSLPVISPDGRYAVYSRVTLEVKPEMYNSKVTSTLFIEDREKKTLRVLTSTSPIRDPLLRAKIASQPETDGTIGVLVPVSWSQKGDRFLARRFEGVFNTADATDQAVVWDRQNNNTNNLAPSQEIYEHDTAVLLGWSKTQPDHVLFRAGKLGDEDWPLVQVSSDGKTVTTTSDVDQPMTYGQKITNVWPGPQIAVR